jgi:hypothetical protein
MALIFIVIKHGLQHPWLIWLLKNMWWMNKLIIYGIFDFFIFLMPQEKFLIKLYIYYTVDERVLINLVDL